MTSALFARLVALLRHNVHGMQHTAQEFGCLGWRLCMMTKPFTSYPCLKRPKAGFLVDLLALTDTPLALLRIPPLHLHFWWYDVSSTQHGEVLSPACAS